jgi:hypothetical protein
MRGRVVAMTELPKAVTAVFEAIESGDWGPVEGVLAPGVVYEGSVPGWHFSMGGAGEVLAELATWTGEHPWRVHERRVTGTERGVLVECELRGRCPGDGGEHAPHEEATRQAIVFELDGDAISEIRLTCCGDWDEATIARIEAEAPRVR